MPTRHVGKISSWKDEKGFGYITPHGGGPRVFFHITALTDPSHRPEGQEVVSYELGEDERGRPRAYQVAYVGVVSDSNALARVPPIVFYSLAGWLVVLTLAFGFKPPLAWAIAGYTAASLITYFAYSIDKGRAKEDGWRISENSLHLLSLIGGWPGAIVAQQRFRHKIRKPAFMAIFWSTAFLNVAGMLLVQPFLK